MNALLHDFVSDTSEAIAGLGDQLTRLADAPDDQRVISGLLHLLHTVRGAAGVLALRRLEALARAGETLLPHLAGPAETATALGLFERIRDVIAYLAAFGVEPAGDDSALRSAAEAAAQRAVTRVLANPLEAMPLPASYSVEHAPAPERRLATQRAPVAALDEILGLAGELVVIRGQLEAAGGDARATAPPMQSLTRAAAALREAALRARLQPFARAAEPLTRLTETLARDLGKPARLSIEGGGVLLDAPLFEAARRALPELIRNAMRHGVETQDERRAAGKPAEARINVAAREEEGCLIIGVKDDGRGFGGVPPISGLGLSVLRGEARTLGGALAVASAPGHGAHVELRLPQALSVTQALLLAVGAEVYALPQHAAAEIIDLTSPAHGAVERANGQLVFRWREALLPLADLAARFDAPPPISAAGAALLVIGNAGTPFGVLVHAVLGIEEIAARRLPKLPCGAGPFCGVTQLRNGRPALILSARAIAAALGLPRAEEFTVMQAARPPEPAAPPRLMLFRDSAGALAALPLSSVLRVEPLRHDSAIVRTLTGWAARLDGRLIPLLAGPGAPPRLAAELPRSGHLLVVGARRPAFALIAAEALGAADLHSPLEAAPGEAGVTGVFPHNGELVRLLDLAWLARRAELCRQELEDSGAAAGAALLVDADPITRDMLRLALDAAGWRVQPADSLAEGAARAAGDEAYGLLVCDLGLAAQDEAGWARLRKACGPAGKRAVGLCAFTSASARELARGLRMARLVGKFDRAALLAAARDMTAQEAV